MSGANSAVILEGRGVSKRFGGLLAVSDVDIALHKQEILGLIGPNGAGKTTLFNMLSGTMPMTQGELYYHGKKIAHPRANRMCTMGIGRTYQICQPFSNLTVLENTMVGAFVRCSRTREARDIAAEVLEKVGLAHRANANGAALTLPELKRMEVARALATRPDVLLLDEVIAGLNPTEVDGLMNLIHSIREDGMSIIIIEHVMKAVMNLSDRIVVINHGEKIAEGLPDEVVKDPQVIESYLGGGAH